MTALPLKLGLFRAEHDRNYRLGVYNGWIGSIGETCINTGIVLATLVTLLGGSNVIIGLLPALAGLGIALPQLLVAGKLRAEPYKLGVYRQMAWLRSSSFVLLVLSSVVFAHQPKMLLVMLLIAWAVNAIATGISSVPFLTVIAKVIPTAQRPGFFGMRQMYGGLLAFFVGLVVRQLMASDIPFPYNYTIILALGAVAFTAGYACFGSIKEPPDEVPAGLTGGVRQEFRSLPETLADPRLRQFLVPRCLLVLAGVADPFYAVYAVRQLGVSPATLGSGLVVMAAAAPLSNLLWIRVAQRKGSRRVLRMATLGALVAPLLALVMPHGAGNLFLLVFLFSALAGPGLVMGVTNYMLNMAPEDERPRYIGAGNTVVGLLSFVPILGGWLVDITGYRVLFVLAAMMLCLSWWTQRKLSRVD